MKILLDENLPKKLKFGFDARHQVSAVRDLGWVGKKNGELLSLMTLNGFEGFITVDKNLANQQNLTRFSIRVFVLNVKNSKIQTLNLFLPKLNQYINDPSADQLVIINI